MAGAGDPHDEYLAACPQDARDRLLAIRTAIEACVPQATRRMAYRMPALGLKRSFVYFAAFRHHVGIYPPLREPDELVDETRRWRGPKGNLSFPHAEPLPVELIGRVGAALAAQYAG